MHVEILDFLRRARDEAEVPASLAGLSVVEFGSYIINGSPREVFTGAGTYIGVDWRAGPGVDVVSLAHDVAVDRADIVLCCQVFEHDPHWERTVRKACEMIRAGGWLFFTWAGPGYQEHELATAPSVDGGSRYYRNLPTEDVVEGVLKVLPDALVVAGYQRGTLDACLWAWWRPEF